MQLRQPGFRYGDCQPFTKNKGKIQKFKETRDLRYFSNTNWIKPAFNMI